MQMNSIIRNYVSCYYKDSVVFERRGKVKNIKKKIMIIGSLFAICLTTMDSDIVQAASWQQNDIGWWWQEDDFSYPVNTWKSINGKWYFFNENGYMLEQGWHWINGKCYYMYESGAMASDTWIGENYVDASGEWIEDKKPVQAQWKQQGNRWWYQRADGSYPINGWEQIKGSWFYFDSTGYMYEQGWHWIDGKCYYMYESGAMAYDTWIDGCYVNASGMWIENMQAQWKQQGNRWWYQRADGSYPMNCWEKINDVWYHFDLSGWMQTGWIEIGGKWYYLNSSGAMASNCWIGNYYLGYDGVMLINAWTPDGYYVGENGAYIEGIHNGLTSRWKEEMLQLINIERAKEGLAALELYNPINHTAQIKAEDMNATGILDHYSGTLGYFSNQYESIGLFYSCGGENIAFGYLSVKDVLNGWMNSSGHRANILNPNYTHVGFGYCNNYWVQQFVGSPEMGETMNCIYCGSKIRTDKNYFTSKDAEGNIYNIYQCLNCYQLNEKCPKCEKGFFKECGLTNLGSISSKCDVCGHNQSQTCITNCPSCNDRILHNSRAVEYKITFDSTKTYDGTSYVKEYGCYFQQIAIDPIVCTSCDKFAIPESSENYEECFAKLKDNLDKKYNAYSIYDYITWEKVVRYELIESDGNTDYYRPVYKFVDTPKVTSMDELIGEKEI